MAESDLDDLYVHTASVEKYLGTNADGADLYDPAVDVACYAEGQRRLVLNADGEQVVSETTVYTYPSKSDLFPPLSLVTVLGGTSRVIRLNTFTSGDLDLPDNLVIALT
jgi:hypothetical protein